MIFLINLLLEILSKSGLLKHHSDDVLNHLMRCYPASGDTPAPIAWSELAVRVLDEAGPSVTTKILRSTESKI